MKKVTKLDCCGCQNNFYNGNNAYGIKECWSFKTATLVKRLQIHVDQAPPYLHVKPEMVPNCKRVERYVMVKPENITKQGFWA